MKIEMQEKTEQWVGEYWIDLKKNFEVG